MRATIKQLLPTSLYTLVKRWRNHRLRTRFATKSLQETFTEIYTQHLWGGDRDAFNSGSGSGARYAAEYAQQINNFVDAHAIRSIVDLGCGDFQIGALLARPGIHYTGVDIVPPLIEENRRRFAGNEVEFCCLDITRDQLPKADLCLIRQVLQHLSNTEIQSVLANCQVYPFVIVTEHVPAGPDLVPNLDKAHGPDIRLYDNSGIYLSEPPFSRHVELLFEKPESDERGGGLLQTVRLHRQPSTNPAKEGHGANSL